MRYLSLRVDDRLYERIRAEADRDRRSINSWTVIQLEELLDRLDRERKRRPKD
jgi:hypothetical protein